jgi:hypothetical protein
MENDGHREDHWHFSDHSRARLCAATGATAPATAHPASVATGLRRPPPRPLPAQPPLPEQKRARSLRSAPTAPTGGTCKSRPRPTSSRSPIPTSTTATGQPDRRARHGRWRLYVEHHHRRQNGLEAQHGPAGAVLGPRPPQRPAGPRPRNGRQRRTGLLQRVPRTGEPACHPRSRLRRCDLPQRAGHLHQAHPQLTAVASSCQLSTTGQGPAASAGGPHLQEAAMRPSWCFG